METQSRPQPRISEEPGYPMHEGLSSLADLEVPSGWMSFCLGLLLVDLGALVIDS